MFQDQMKFRSVGIKREVWTVWANEPFWTDLVSCIRRNSDRILLEEKNRTRFMAENCIITLSKPATALSRYEVVFAVEGRESFDSVRTLLQKAVAYTAEKHQKRKK